MSERLACETVRKRFLALEEGALGAEAVRAVQEHLAACAACRAAWEGWQSDDRALREAMVPERPPRDVAGSALAVLRGEARSRRAARRRAAVRWAAAAAAALLAIVGVMTYRARRYERIGEVAAAEGQPQVRQRGGRGPAVARARTAIYNGAELLTAPGERLTLRFADGSRLVVAAGTKATLSGAGYRRDCGHTLPHVCLHRGEVLCELKSLRYFRGVGTPLGTAIVEGTTFRIRYVRGQWTLLEVLEGAVQFSCTGGEVRAEAGTTWVSDSRDLLPRKVSGVFD